MSSWARPGVKCVCVSTTVGFAGVAPKVGETYVVLSSWRNGPVSGKPQAVFGTLDGQPLHSGGGILIERFRPLVSQSDDVALFTHHLDTTKLPERV